MQRWRAVIWMCFGRGRKREHFRGALEGGGPEWGGWWGNGNMCEGLDLNLVAVFFFEGGCQC